MSKIETNIVEQTMRDFAHNVVQRARLNLKPGRLKESIRSDLDVFDSGNFSLSFFMEEYGLFQDMGVSGTKRKWGTIGPSGQRLTRFKYTDKQPPTTPIANWAKKNFIRFRDKDGKFVKGGYESIGFVIARSIKRKGIKPSLFFTRPFKRLFAELPDEIIEAYGLEVDKALDTWLVDQNYSHIKVTKR